MERPNQEILFERATMYYNQRQFQTCIELLEKSLNQKPSTMGYNNIAIAHYRLGHIHEAFRDLNKSIELDHLNFISYFNLFSLHALQEATKDALSCLILAVSSINTVACRQAPNVKQADRALALSYNNKEAMMMRGLLHLQKSEYLESLKMIKAAIEWQNSRQNLQAMLSLFTSLSKLAGEEAKEPEIKNVRGSKYQLKTDIDSIETDKYSNLIVSLLSEFNHLYWNLTEEQSQDNSEQVKSKCCQQINSSFIDSASISHRQDSHWHSSKEDEEGNKATTNNSVMGGNDPESSIVQSDKNKEYDILSIEHPECLHVQPSTQNSIIPEEPSTISEAILTLQQEKSMKSVAIKFVLYHAQISPQIKNPQLYTILEYDSQHNKVFRSSLSKPEANYHLWNESSAPFLLSTNPSTLTLKLYSKEYSRFRDELIGQTTLEINQLGVASLPLLDRRNRQTGTLLLGVTLSQ